MAPPPPQPPYPWPDPPRPLLDGEMYVEAPDELSEEFTLVLAREYRRAVAGIPQTPRIVELARASNLYGPDHIGADLTGGDGRFESLRVSPAGGGPAAVLVTTWNLSFVEAGPRRELLEILRQIELGLLETGEKSDRPD